jgi:hypothetical protein
MRSTLARIIISAHLVVFPGCFTVALMEASKAPPPKSTDPAGHGPVPALRVVAPFLLPFSLALDLVTLPLQIEACFHGGFNELMGEEDDEDDVRPTEAPAQAHAPSTGAE